MIKLWEEDSQGWKIFYDLSVEFLLQELEKLGFILVKEKLGEDKFGIFLKPPDKK